MPGGNWSCIFDDEFDGSSLDTSKWVVQQTDNSGYTTGTDPDRACYVDNVNTVSVSGGDLHLSIQKASTPFTCNDPRGFVHDRLLGRHGLDRQSLRRTYGAFEVSGAAPLGGGRTAGDAVAVATQCKHLRQHVALIRRDRLRGVLQRLSDIRRPLRALRRGVERPGGHRGLCHRSCRFNTYGVDWQPGSIAIYLNGVQCLVDHPDPASPLVSPEPFDQPFFLVLTQAIGFGSNTPFDGVTQFPSTTLVDWARAWQG